MLPALQRANELIPRTQVRSAVKSSSVGRPWPPPSQQTRRCRPKIVAPGRSSLASAAPSPYACRRGAILGALRSLIHSRLHHPAGPRASLLIQCWREIEAIGLARLGNAIYPRVSSPARSHCLHRCVMPRTTQPSSTTPVTWLLRHSVERWQIPKQTFYGGKKLQLHSSAQENTPGS